jgi:RNA polymerase sigma factor (sigma-70 family)
MTAESDADLVALARAGDKGAFGRLVERYQQMAKYIAVRMVANEDIARELAQEAMLQAYLSLDHLRDDERFKNWLYGIVLNVCRSYVRDRKIDPYSLEVMAGGLQSEAVPFSSTAPDPYEVAERRDLHRKVMQAVNDLSPKPREATRLFYYEQLSLQGTATTLGISVAAVKGRLHRARGRLREKLLPLYSEVSQPTENERKREMMEVTIADVAEHYTGQYLVVLLDKVGRRVLPIFVGEPEALAIAIYLLEQSMPRPLTHDFMANLLEAVGVEPEECVSRHCGKRPTMR